MFALIHSQPDLDDDDLRTLQHHFAKLLKLNSWYFVLKVRLMFALMPGVHFEVWESLFTSYCWEDLEHDNLIPTLPGYTYGLALPMDTEFWTPRVLGQLLLGKDTGRYLPTIPLYSGSPERPYALTSSVLAYV